MENVSQYGFCNLSVIPLREEPSHKSQMQSQILFGESYFMIEEQKEWLKIKLSDDKYEGWINIKQHISISEKEFKLLSASPACIAKSFYNKILDVNSDNIIHIAPGSSLPGLKDNELTVIDIRYKFEGKFVQPPFQAEKVDIIQDSLMFLNAPYLWGGLTPFGIDCSGFSQIIYKMNGIQLERDACDQAGQGTTISFIEEANDGDLVFFDDEEGNIIHVGIAMNKNEIIHASGKVRIDKLDHHGIFNKELQKYTHKLRLIKRLV